MVCNLRSLHVLPQGSALVGSGSVQIYALGVRNECAIAPFSHNYHRFRCLRLNFQIGHVFCQSGCCYQKQRILTCFLGLLEEKMGPFCLNFDRNVTIAGECKRRILLIFCFLGELLMPSIPVIPIPVCFLCITIPQTIYISIYILVSYIYYKEVLCTHYFNWNWNNWNWNKWRV